MASATRRPLKTAATTSMSTPGELYVHTQADLARFFGTTGKSIESWRVSGAPDRTPSGWPLGGWVRWRVAVLASRTAGNAAERLKTAQADLAESKLARERLEVIAVETVEAERVNRMRWFVGCMSRAAGELAGKLTGRAPVECRQIVADYFEAVRREAVSRK